MQVRVLSAVPKLNEKDRMIDFERTYYSFLKAKRLKCQSKGEESKGEVNSLQKKLHCRVEGHHVLPACEGGQRKGNIVFLREADHCLAHLLLNAAKMQKGLVPLSYGIRPCIFKEQKVFWPRSWTPFFHLKVRVQAEGRDYFTLSLNDAVKMLCVVMRKNWKETRAKNNAFALLLGTMLSEGKHKYAGYRWIPVFEPATKMQENKVQKDEQSAFTKVNN